MLELLKNIPSWLAFIIFMSVMYVLRKFAQQAKEKQENEEFAKEFGLSLEDATALRQEIQYKACQYYDLYWKQEEPDEIKLSDGTSFFPITGYEVGTKRIHKYYPWFARYYNEIKEAHTNTDA